VINWVEKKTAPDTIIASKVVNGQVAAITTTVPVSAGRAPLG
jgi:hypothetical protein